MSLHATPEDHDADPPSAWIVRKVADRCWHLDSSLTPGFTIGYFKRRSDAEAAKVSGPEVSLYEKEGRWFAGLPVANWRPYADIVAERTRRAQRNKPGLGPGGVRYHSSDDMDGLGELAGVSEPVAVVIRPGGSVDVYGCVAVIDQRPA